MGSMLRAWAFAAGFLASGARAAAEGQGTPAPAPGMEGLLTTVGGLVLILGLILGGAWLVKRLGHVQAGGRGPVRVVGGVSLGARERVVVVEVDDARLVLGVAPGRVQTLHVLSAGASFEQSLGRAREQVS